jgi:HK97 family phage portal protein
MNIENFVGRIARIRAIWNGGAKGVDAPFADPRSWLNVSGGGVYNSGRKPRSKAEFVEQFNSWVYVCAKLNAMSCASVPLQLYAAKDSQDKQFKTISTRRVPKKRMREIKKSKSLRPYIRKAEDIDEVTEHVFLDLMKNVNPFFNASDLFELTVLDMDLTGEAYWYVVKGKAGQPVELWPLPSIYMRAVPGKTLDTFIDHYSFQRGRTEVILELDEVIQFNYPNPGNLIQGFSCVRGVVDAVYSNSKMNEYEEALFSNKARTGGVFQSEAAVAPSEVDRMRADIEAKYAGTANSGRPMMLPPGVTWVKDTMTNEEMSFIEGRRLTREEIAAGFDVPIALLDPESIRANVDGAQYYHAKYGIAPRLRKIEEKLNEKLLPMFDDSGVLFAAFENPVPEDEAAALAERTGYVGSGIMAINEARADLGLEPADGGDEPLVPFNLVPLTQAIKEPEPIPAPLVPGVPDGDEPEPKPEDEEDDLAQDAEKLADMTLAKLREKLGVK